MMEDESKKEVWYLIDSGTHRYWNDYYTLDQGELVTTQFSNPVVNSNWERFTPKLEEDGKTFVSDNS